MGDSTSIRVFSGLVALDSGVSVSDPGRPRKDLVFKTALGGRVDYYNTPYMEDFLGALPRVLASKNNTYDVVVFNVGLHDLRYRPRLGLTDDLETRVSDMVAAVQAQLGLLPSSASGGRRPLFVWREYTRVIDSRLATWVTGAPQFNEANVSRLNAVVAAASKAPILLWRVHAMSAASEIEELDSDGLHVPDPVAIALAEGLAAFTSFSVPSKAAAKSSESHGGLTAGQKSLFVLVLIGTALWALAEVRQLQESGRTMAVAFASSWLPASVCTLLNIAPEAEASDSERREDEGRLPTTVPISDSAAAPAAAWIELPRVTGAQMTSASALPLLRNLVLLGAILMYVYLCDGDAERKLWPMGKRVYSRDVFLFVNGVIVLMSFLTLEAERKPPGALLNRAQTEEWKGWMQVAFVLYHYFAAKETYNVIRLFISAYVWMTGFGNFSYFYIRKDFTLVRFAKMMFRLNFLVTFFCIALAREYMLYYVCALHTFAFLSVYAVMRIGASRNENVQFMSAKLVGCFLLFALLFEVDGVFQLVFSPLRWLLQFEGSMHEWQFRAHLDHYMPLLGMLSAYLHPNISALLARLEALPSTTQARAKIVIGGAATAVLLWWSLRMYPMDKFAYNILHPYTSFVPIAAYMVVRNISSTARTYSLYLFGWLGKITLETYLLQFHTWLSADAKSTTAYLPAYPLVNFALASAIFILLAYKLFHITVFLSDALVPQGITRAALLGRLAFCAAVFGVPYMVFTSSSLLVGF